MHEILNQENLLNHIEKINEKIILYEKNDFLFSLLNDFLSIYIYFVFVFVIINFILLRSSKNKMINYINQENKNNLFYNYLLFINKNRVITLLFAVMVSVFFSTEVYKEAHLNMEKEKIINVELNEDIIYDVLVEYEINEIKRTDDSYIVHYEEDDIFKKIDISSNKILITIGNENKVSVFDSMNVIELLENKRLDKRLNKKIESLISLQSIAWLERNNELKPFKSIKKIQLTEETYLSLLNNQQEVGEINE